MSSTVAREIIRRMKAVGLNPSSLSKRAKLNATAVRDIIEGNSQSPKIETAQAIAKALNCTVGELLREKPVRSVDGIVEINELNVYATSGDGGAGGSLGEGEYADAIAHNEESGLIVGVHSMPEASFREAYGIAPTRIKIIAVKGNSMEPTLWPGQRVMVDVQDKTPSPPGIFVVFDGLALVLKFVEVIPNSDPLRVRISSANSAFLPYERLVDEAYINGRVVGVWARM